MAGADAESEPLTTSGAAAVGGGFLRVAMVTGGMGVLLARILGRALRLRADGPETLRNLYKMGVKSVPIVVITALFVGAIMVIQAAPVVNRYGAHALLGWAAGFSTLREIGPLLTALMLSGRVGANNAAELGTMVVTEQIDALRALAIDPISFLIVPRFFGIVVTVVLSTISSDALALLGAAFCGWVMLGVPPLTFYYGVTSGLLDFGDVLHGIIKSGAFGLIIALSSCQFGMATSGGAPGVGRSVNSTVVVSAIGIFAFDYLVSFLV